MTQAGEEEMLAHAIDEGVYTDLASLLRFRRPAADLGVFRSGMAKSLLLGNVRSRFRGRGMEFEEARLYQPGDDIRSIDWRVSARTGKTHTKVYAEERERPVHLLLDQRDSMFFGSQGRFKSVLAAELAACLAWAALGASDRIGGQVVSDTREADIRAQRNKKAILHFLTEVVEFNQALPNDRAVNEDESSPRPMSYILEECRRLARPGTTVFVLSDFIDFDEESARVLHGLGRHTELTLFWVRDPIEFDLDLAGRLGMSDGRQTRAVDFSSKLKERYREEQRIHKSRIEQAAIRSRARLVEVSTSNDPLTFLRALYRS